MSISKLKVEICVAVLVGGVLAVQADPDTPAQAAARAALMKRIHDADTNQPPTLMVNTVPSGSTMTPEQTKVIQDAAAQANAKKAQEEQAQQLATQKVKEQPAQDNADMAKTAALHASYPGKELGFAPPMVPPSPITPDKQNRLDLLLIQYKANQISPEEYHKERAAILGEP